MPPDLSDTTRPSVVTRTEIIDHVAAAFTSGPATTAELVSTALESGARPEVLTVLGRLLDQRFMQPQDLWSELPDLPIGG